MYVGAEIPQQETVRVFRTLLRDVGFRYIHFSLYSITTYYSGVTYIGTKRDVTIPFIFRTIYRIEIHTHILFQQEDLPLMFHTLYRSFNNV